MAFSSFSSHVSCSYSNNDVNAEILKSYTGSSSSLPALVLVNHDKVGSILASFPFKGRLKTGQFCLIRQTNIWIVACSSNLQLACDCHLRPEKCDKSLIRVSTSNQNYSTVAADKIKKKSKSSRFLSRLEIEGD